MSLRQQNKAKARAAILAATETLVTERGLEATTMRDIASRAEVSYQTLYNYFPTKGQVLAALLEEEMNIWSRRADQIIKQYDGDLVGTFCEITRQSMEHIRGDREELWFALAVEIFRHGPEKHNLSSLSHLAHEQCYALLHLATGMGHLREDVDLHLMAHTLFCLTDYSILTFFLMPMEEEQFLATQRQQLELVLGPYLIDSRD